MTSGFVVAFFALSLGAGCSQQTPPRHQSASQTTSGICSPAIVAGGNVTVTCQGLDPSLVKHLHAILNKIAANQLDPTAVLTKLDELRTETHDIKLGVEQILRKQEGRRLSQDQKDFLRQRLAAVPSKPRIKMMVTNNTPESMRFAEDFDDVFKGAGWTVEMFPNMVVGSVLPKGQAIIVKSADNQAAGYIQNLFRTIGISLVGSIGTDVDSDLIVIAIWPSPEN